MKRYTEKEIQSLKFNPNVKYIDEKCLRFTYEFRLKLYYAWEKSPCSSTIRQMMIEGGIDESIICTRLVADLGKNFREYGCPQNGKNNIADNLNVPKEQAIQELLKTGKFEKAGKGIRITKEFEDEIREQYPAKTLEQIFKDSEISLGLVGYQRLYQIKRLIESSSGQCDTFQKGQHTFTPEELREMEAHPYVCKATSHQLEFWDALYFEAQSICSNLSDMDIVFDIFEIPKEWITASKRNAMLYQIRHASERKDRQRQVNLSQLSEEGKQQYLRIQRNRIQKLEEKINGFWSDLKINIPQMTPIQRKRVCEWIRDDFPKAKRGPNSLRGILNRIGISKSYYYSVIGNDEYEKKINDKEKKLESEMQAIRTVVEYGGYPKGSRQVYMQMKTLTGKHMGRRKIMNLMQRMHLQCNVRKANPGRRAMKKHLKDHVKPNLLKREFKLHRPGEVYLTDVTYLKYDNGRKLAYGSACIDSVTGRLYEFNLSEYNNLEFVLETLQNIPHPDTAYERIQPLLHSDQGVLYLTDEFQELVKELGFKQSMSKRGNCWDNAPQESFFGHFKDEVDYKKMKSIEDLRKAVNDYKTYYNEVRGKWDCNKMTPLKYEAYINNMSQEEFAAWQEKEEKRYEEKKKESREKAIERAKSLGV